jgi:hypothetical protein
MVVCGLAAIAPVSFILDNGLLILNGSHNVYRRDWYD